MLPVSAWILAWIFALFFLVRPGLVRSRKTPLTLRESICPMDLPQALERQVTYDTWANQEMFGFLVGCDLVSPKTWSLFDHLLGTSANWIARLEEREPDLAIWPELTSDQRPEELTGQARAWREYIRRTSEAELERPLTYTNSKGTPFSAMRLDIVQHVLAHGHYHRGQIASALRRVGVDPPWTDPIVWTRLNGER